MKKGVHEKDKKSECSGTTVHVQSLRARTHAHEKAVFVVVL